MRRLAPLCAALLLSGGCSAGIFDESRSGLHVDFTVAPAALGNFFEPQVTVTGGEREIVVDGLVSAPSPCQSLGAWAGGEGGTIDLAVRLEPVGEACVGAIGNFGYRARVRNVSPGTYTVRLEHRWPGTGWPVHRREHQVTVR